jgi:hypothetical protein
MEKIPLKINGNKTSLKVNCKELSKQARTAGYVGVAKRGGDFLTMAGGNHGRSVVRISDPGTPCNG